MANALVSVPSPRNEPVLSYAPGTPERRALRAQLERMSKEIVEITPRLGGRKVETGRVGDAVMPHNHHHVLARWHKAGPAEVARAIEAAREAHGPWSRMAWEQRAA